MGVIWHKIWSDIWNNKGRTAQVALIIAMGAFAIGMIITASEVVSVRLGQVWRASAPAMINLSTDPPIDDERLTALKSIKGVKDVEGYLSSSLEWRLSPAQPWTPGSLIARADYKDQTYARLELLKGHWPARKTVAVEKGAESYFNIPQGQRVYLRLNDHEYTMQVDGLLYNASLQPPGFGGKAQFYASRDEFANLTGEQNFNQILAAAPIYDEASIKDLADRMQRQLEKLDVDSGGAAPVDGDNRVMDPNKHFLQNSLDAIFLILGVMGGLIFDPIITTSANVPRQVMLRAMDSVNKASTVWIQTERTDAAGEAEMAKGLRAYFDTHELKLNPGGMFAGQDTASAATAQILSNFGIIVKMLAAMAVIIALVGSIALSGVLSLNVRERTREIGVMRAIGASSWSIARLFIGEGLILGLLSWLIALPLSLPAGYLMVQALGAALNNEIVFHYTPAGALYWLVIITVLAIAASWLPAQGATRVSVRESLAYQ